MVIAQLLPDHEVLKQNESVWLTNGMMICTNEPNFCTLRASHAIFRMPACLPACSPELPSTESGRLLMGTHLQRLTTHISDGTLYEKAKVHIPPSKPIITEPGADVVLGLNLLAYWFITKSANRG